MRTMGTIGSIRAAATLKYNARSFVTHAPSRHLRLGSGASTGDQE